MVDSKREPSFTFGGPGLYRIVVQGWLDPGDADRLGGMKITVDSAKQREPAATLVGRLKDQAQLSGVLNALYEMHLTILTVQALPRDIDDNNEEEKE
jgi:hypothetical protein